MISFHCSEMISYHVTDIIFIHGFITLISTHNNLLLTERQGRTGEYRPEVVTVRTERSEVCTKTTEKTNQSTGICLELGLPYNNMQ